MSLEQLSTQRLYTMFKQLRDTLYNRTQEDYEYFDFLAQEHGEEYEDDDVRERMEEIKEILDTREHMPRKPSKQKRGKNGRSKNVKRG